MLQPLCVTRPDCADSSLPAANQEANLQHARLVMSDGKRYAALTGQGTQWVIPAAGCLLQPAVGDLALVSLMGGQGYILTVLERGAPETPAEVTVPGDLRLSLPEGRLELAAARGMALDAGPALNVVARQLTAALQGADLACQALRLAGDEACSQWNTRTDVAGSRLDIATRSESHVEHSVRRIAGHEEVTAQSMRHTVEQDWSVRADTASLKARERVALAAASVQLG
ncbi:DUF3540 domain-containing protein [Bordetella sp. BOR01]|uniref:DUF3540 domain-containing protein n=1 Tax=Bordetella sp. BOR01 TaxID=2854779 RepID=UPI001C472882|nr:DUF3540 domain-containing protein [Bordetella sp. BOR01]MBV7486024.1 DUF3540 domain-containing protein [Bordetella sp. BOR01]